MTKTPTKAEALAELREDVAGLLRLVEDHRKASREAAAAYRAVEAERDALRAALTRVLDTHEREAKAYLTAQVASENFSRRSAKADEHAHLQAAVEASKAEKEARELLAAMKGTT